MISVSPEQIERIRYLRFVQSLSIRRIAVSMGIEPWTVHRVVTQMRDGAEPRINCRGRQAAPIEQLRAEMAVMAARIERLEKANGNAA